MILPDPRASVRGRAAAKGLIRSPVCKTRIADPLASTVKVRERHLTGFVRPAAIAVLPIPMAIPVRPDRERQIPPVGCCQALAGQATGTAWEACAALGSPNCRRSRTWSATSSSMTSRPVANRRSSISGASLAKISKAWLATSLSPPADRSSEPTSDLERLKPR